MMMKNIVALGLLILLLGACKQNHHRVTLDGVSFTVALADDNNSRAMGLMYREEMADDEGMLFIFPDSQIRSFWMKNTLIPLDILSYRPQQKNSQHQ